MIKKNKCKTHGLVSRSLIAEYDTKLTRLRPLDVLRARRASAVFRRTVAKILIKRNM